MKVKMNKSMYPIVDQWKQYIWIVLAALLAGACSSSEEGDDDFLADLYPIGLELAIYDSHGQNLLASRINGDSLSNYAIRFEFDGVLQDFDALYTNPHIRTFDGENRLDMVPSDVSWYLFFKQPKPFRYTVRLTSPEVFGDEKEHTIDAKMVECPESLSIARRVYDLIPDPDSVFVDGVKATPMKDDYHVTYKVRLPITQ